MLLCQAQNNLRNIAKCGNSLEFVGIYAFRSHFKRIVESSGILTKSSFIRFYLQVPINKKQPLLFSNSAEMVRPQPCHNKHYCK